ncbi:hypothetical protein ACCD06_10515 [Azospirillum sp. CT11-132]|uniref:hypothetical protein n=1 Tax=unclassified Azospirillum TaxID=2630922 RepID=UPI000D62263E|nr:MULTISPECIES: hypothetical protein [unclassified Azospirillum]PWC62541.1 hypothetical protein TSH20_21695 [Azospirillum sp. TSH20]PWC67543.1 hypothetical protein TSH7_04315 [Azospirillum sp. TSH7]
MPIPLDPVLIEEFTKLLGNEGIHDISHWVLPNDDVPFDETVALERYKAMLDEEFEASSEGIKQIVASEDAQKAKA